jgi:PAS domain S-box-containing protein
MSEDQSSIRVLHVDDESEFLDLATTYLSRQDDRFTIETATSADAGLDCLATDEFDCVISDYDMPGMTGIDFLQAVREDSPDLPFILFTGKGSEEVASEAISAGVTDYLQKQRGTEQYELLANRVTNAVEQRRARTQAQEHHRVSSVVRKINRALVQARSREEIDHRVCQILTDADPYVLAWIGTVDPATDRIEPQAAAGSGEEAYLDTITVTVDDSPTGHGPGGTAVRENRVVVSQDIDQDETFAPWREDAREQGYRAVAAIPLTHEDTRYGLLAVYADPTGAFDESERALLEELGDTIAHAYHRLDIQQEYADQYRDLFEEAPVMFTFTREVDGEPIIEDCNQLFAETLGYDREELRDRPLADVYTDESAQALLSGGGYDRALAGEFVREQRELVTREGDVVTTLLRATPRRNADGEVIGTHALFVDITDQTRLQTLEEHHDRIEFALDATDSTLFELDLESDQETRHGPFERLYGIESAAVETNEDFYEKCVHPDDRDTLRDLQRKEELAEGGGTVACDFRTHPDRGPERWIHFEGYVSTDSDGTPKRLVGLDTDITERKQRETQLKEEQSRFETLFSQLTVPLVEVEYNGLDPIVTDVNPAFEETFGYDAATIVGESLDAMIVPDDRQDEAEDINRYVREGGRLNSREVTRHTADGLRQFLLENAVYEDGSGGFAFYTDITDRKEREQELEDQYRYLFEEAPIMIVETRAEDGEPCLEDCNQRFAETVGCDKEDVLERSLAEFYTADSRRRLLEGGGYERSLAGVLRTEERELVTTDGDIVETRVRAVPRYDADGETVGTIGYFIDISERKQLQRERDRLEKFTGIVSHDLRNPLKIASGRLELAREECDSEHLHGVAKAHARMESLIDDLLTLAREGKKVTDPEPVALDELIENCWQTVDTAAATLVADVDRTMWADQSRVRQLLENLLRNAVDHGGDDVTITVGTLDEGFYVADDGPGIPEEEREHIFESGYTTSDDGTGFGLVIVQEIANAHDWQIRATESEAGGARFEITGVEFSAV